MAQLLSGNNHAGRSSVTAAWREGRRGEQDCETPLKLSACAWDAGTLGRSLRDKANRVAKPNISGMRKRALHTSVGGAGGSRDSGRRTRTLITGQERRPESNEPVCRRTFLVPT